MGTRIAVAVVAVAALATLSGCAWLDPPAQTGSAPAVRKSVPAPTTDRSGVGTLPDGIAFDRETVSEAAATRLDCSGGSVTIDGFSGSYAIDGDCEAVTVKGDGNTVTAGHVGRLRVEGYAHVVLVDSVGSLTLPTGTTGCVVQWETGTPDIDNDAADSFLTQAKG